MQNQFEIYNGMKQLTVDKKGLLTFLFNFTTLGDFNTVEKMLTIYCPENDFTEEDSSKTIQVHDLMDELKNEIIDKLAQSDFIKLDIN